MSDQNPLDELSPIARAVVVAEIRNSRRFKIAAVLRQQVSSSILIMALGMSLGQITHPYRPILYLIAGIFALVPLAWLIGTCIQRCEANAISKRVNARLRPPSQSN